MLVADVLGLNCAAYQSTVLLSGMLVDWRCAQVVIFPTGNRELRVWRQMNNLC